MRKLIFIVLLIPSLTFAQNIKVNKLEAKKLSLNTYLVDSITDTIKAPFESDKLASVRAIRNYVSAQDNLSTLQTVTDRGNTTTQNLSIGSRLKINTPMDGTKGINFGYSSYYNDSIRLSGIDNGIFSGISANYELNVLKPTASTTGDLAVYYGYNGDKVAGIFLDDDATKGGLTLAVWPTLQNANIIDKISLADPTSIGSAYWSYLPPSDGLIVKGSVAIGDSVVETGYKLSLKGSLKAKGDASITANLHLGQNANINPWLYLYSNTTQQGGVFYNNNINHLGLANLNKQSFLFLAEGLNGLFYTVNDEDFTVWHSGNSNLSTVNWNTLDLNVYGTPIAPNLALASITNAKHLTTKEYVDNAVLGGLNYLGAWNANTNTPAISDATGSNGDTYIVQVGGTRDLGSGSIVFTVGGWVIHNGSIWQFAGTANEIDPVFIAWNKSTGISITTSQITDFQTAVSNNTDVAASITQADGDARYLQLTSRELKKAWIALGTNGAVSWDMNQGYNASIAITGNVTLTINNSQDGDYGTLYIDCAATAYTITITSGAFPGAASNNIFTTSANNDAENIISFVRKGTKFYFSSGANYVNPI